MNPNIVVRSSKWTDQDIKTLFLDEDVTFVDEKPMPNLLVELGIYKSTSQARNANRTGNIPKGWTEYKASKKKTLWIWNPDE